jgi:serine protease Do
VTAIVRLASAGLLLVLAAVHGAPAQVPTTERLKNSLELLIAFEPVIAEARRATVQVVVDGRQVALGTIVDADGYVLTKASELGGPAVCRLQDGRTFAAVVAGTDNDFDLALLRIDAQDLPTVRWTNHGEPQVGQWLASVGLDPVPLSVGVVSVRSRPVAAEQGVLGIVISETKRGPRISQVIPNSGADRSGLRVGDVITNIGGDTVRSGHELTAAIQNRHPGDLVNVNFVREDREQVVEARLGVTLMDSVSRAELEQQLDGDLSTRRAGFPSVIEHDSLLRPADCGGPIVNLSGETVGINIARAGRAESFAILARDALRIVEALKGSG